MLEVFLGRHHLLSSSMWRPVREMYSIILIFGFVDLIFDTQSLYKNYIHSKITGYTAATTTQ